MNSDNEHLELKTEPEPDPEPEPEPETGTANSSIDQLTLALLMNKNHYRKYIATADPTKSAELESYHSNLRKYRRQILDITNEMVDHPTSSPVSTDAADAFESYVRTLVRHFQMKEAERDNKYYTNDNDNDNDNENTMFGTVDENPSVSSSFWGKQRVSRQGYNADSSIFRKFK